MRSPILEAAERVLFPLQLLFVVYFLLRGHQAPGGGFIAGLMLAGAYRFRLWVRPVVFRPWLLGGLWLALLSSLLSLLAGLSWMTGVWSPGLGLPILGKFSLSSVLLFDLGVFFVVFGMMMTLWEAGEEAL